jgi:integrase
MGDPVFHVQKGKGTMGKKDRYVPLPQKTLLWLREQWKSHRNKVWLFPSAGRSCKYMPYATRPISNSSVQTDFRKGTELEKLGGRHF